MNPSPRGPTVRSFAIVGGLEAIARGITLSVFPLALYRHWESAATVSQIYLGNGLLSLATILMLPSVLRHVPRRWMHSFAVLLYIASGVLGIVSGSALAAALLCSAVGTSIAFVCYNANALDHFNKAELGRLESMRIFYAGVGWAGGPFIGVWLFSLWRGAPFVVVIVAATLMLASLWWMRIGPVQLGSRQAAAFPNPLRVLHRFLQQPRLIAGWWLAVLRGCGWSVYLVYAGIFAVQQGLGERVGGITASLASMGLFLSPLMLRWIMSRPLRQSVRIGFLYSGLCFLLAWLSAPLPWLTIALLLLGAYFLVLLDICGGLPFLMAVRPSERNEMSAIYATFRDCASILTPAMVWLVLQVGPLSAVFAAGGLGLLVAWLIAGRMHPLLGLPPAQRQRLRARD